MATFPQFDLDSQSEIPLYKQIADALKAAIASGKIGQGDRLPATRELAGQLGLNRATVSAAYALLEQSGAIQGHVGRGSFVSPSSVSGEDRAGGLDWNALLPPPCAESTPNPVSIEINFASSRPDQSSFPIAAFRRLTREAIDTPQAEEILQLGSSYGYAPLRRYLLEHAVEEGIARSGDSLLMTNGCQQALDLIARLFSSSADSAGGVVVEDPVYHGLLRVFSRTGMPILPVPVTQTGLDLAALEETLLRHRPRLLVVTPSFHNPTGATLSLANRRRLVKMAADYGLVLVENDIYSQLRYSGERLPSLKELDETGNTILLRSYSKVAFPGLRVGWVIAPHEVIARLAEEKQIADLHSDHLSQAVLLRFTQSGELERHLELTRLAGSKRLEAVLSAMGRYLPPGTTWTIPEGGMSLWVELPAPLATEDVLRACQKLGLDFLPGRHFSRSQSYTRNLRISFGGLTPDKIVRGMQILGDVAAGQIASLQKQWQAEPAIALV